MRIALVDIRKSFVFALEGFETFWMIICELGAYFL